MRRETYTGVLGRGCPSRHASCGRSPVCIQRTSFRHRCPSGGTTLLQRRVATVCDGRGRKPAAQQLSPWQGVITPLARAPIFCACSRADSALRTLQCNVRSVPVAPFCFLHGYGVLRTDDSGAPRELRLAHAARHRRTAFRRMAFRREQMLKPAKPCAQPNGPQRSRRCRMRAHVSVHTPVVSTARAWM